MKDKLPWQTIGTVHPGRYESSLQFKEDESEHRLQITVEGDGRF